MKKLMHIALGSLLLVMLATPLCFAETKTNASEKAAAASAESAAVRNLALAGELAKYGAENENPVALYLAAQIMKDNQGAEKAQTKTTTGEGAEAAAGEGELASPAALLEQAGALAKKDARLLAMIDAETKREGSRSRVGGAARHIDRVQPNHTDVYEITFRGDEEAAVYVEGDGDNDLDLYVYDENGNLVGRDVDRGDVCLVTWTPAWTGKFTVKIKNLGSSVYSEYLLATN